VARETPGELTAEPSGLKFSPEELDRLFRESEREVKLRQQVKEADRQRTGPGMHAGK
jgi:hypothetical protein